MSLRPVDDPDPLLEFSDEAGVAGPSAPPPGPALQPVAATEDRSPIQQPPEFDRDLIARVETLERDLDRSKNQVAALKTELATLVRAVADIRKQPIPPSLTLPKLPPARVVAARTPKIAGLILGTMLAVGGWMYLSNDTDVSIAAPASDTAGLAPNATSAAESYAGGLAPNVAPVAESYAGGLAPNVARAAERSDRAQSDTAGLAPKVASVRESNNRGQPPKVAARAARNGRGQPADVVRAANADVVRAAKFVGTLSIDADPGGEVFINRQSAGHTPLRLTNLRAGSHLIWVERDGYRRWTRVVQVPADRVTRLSAELEPLAR